MANIKELKKAELIKLTAELYEQLNKQEEELSYLKEQNKKHETALDRYRGLVGKQGGVRNPGVR